MKKKTLGQKFKKTLAIVIVILQLMGLFAVSFSVNAAPESNGTTAVSSETQTLSKGEGKEISENQNANDTNNEATPAHKIFLIILIVAAIVFLLCGYVFFKKWLPVKICYQNSRKIKIFKPYSNLSTLASVLIPFMPVTANMCVFYEGKDQTPRYVKFAIKANGKHSAVILNTSVLYEQGISFDEKPIEPIVKLLYTKSKMYYKGEKIITFIMP